MTISCYKTRPSAGRFVRRDNQKPEPTAIPDLPSSPLPNSADAVVSARWRRWAGAAAVLGLWQLGWAVDLIPPIGLPSPLEIALAMWHLIASGELWFHLEATLPRLGLGWVLGAGLAIAAHLASRRSTAARSLAAALATTVGSVPAIALMPLLVIWLGAGEASTIATTALAAFVPAIRAAPADGDRQRARIVIEALHASLPFALAVLVAIEMINGSFGLGALVYGAAELYRSDQIIAGCLVLAVIGIGLSALLRLAGERHRARESR